MSSDSVPKWKGRGNPAANDRSPGLWGLCAPLQWERSDTKSVGVCYSDVQSRVFEQ